LLTALSICNPPAKFLVDGTGKVVKRYAPDMPPKALVKDIEAL
jgi:glutathione peroxidase-family protein